MRCCVIFDCVILVLVLWCTIHDHIRIGFYLSLCVLCVCILCICRCFFAVINRCQRIFIRVLFCLFCSFYSHLFILVWLPVLIRLLIPYRCLTRPLPLSLFAAFVFLRVSLVSYRGGVNGGSGLLLFAIDCPIYILHTVYNTRTHTCARHSHFYVKHFSLRAMSSLLSIELNRWVDFKWIGRADSTFLYWFLFSLALSVPSIFRHLIPNVFCVSALWIHTKFYFSFCDFIKRKKLRFRYMFIVCARVSGFPDRRT